MSNTTYEPNDFELIELEFKHAVEDAAEFYLNDHIDDDPEGDYYYTGDAMNVMADLMMQRFQYAELMLHDNHSDNVNCDGKKATKTLYSNLAKKRPSMHIAIGMLNSNTEYLQTLIKAYPEQFNIVWSIYVTTFMKVHRIDSIYLQKSFLNYKVDIDQ